MMPQRSITGIRNAIFKLGLTTKPQNLNLSTKLANSPHENLGKNEGNSEKTLKLERRLAKLLNVQFAKINIGPI